MRRFKNINSEPRMTREMLRKSYSGSVSVPTSPTQVVLDSTQNLQHVLRPRFPLVPEAVDMNNSLVQNLEQALQETGLTYRDNQPRLRKGRKINYKLFHEHGRRFQRIRRSGHAGMDIYANLQTHIYIPVLEIYVFLDFQNILEILLLS